MVKQILTVIGISTLFSSCTVFKSLDPQNSKSLPASSTIVVPNKFIETISVTADADPKQKTVKQEIPVLPTTKGPSMSAATIKEENVPGQNLTERFNPSGVELANPVQFKYAILMNTEIETLPNKTLLEGVDNWYGVRYRSGGNDHKGIDCSGFTLAVYAAVYGITLPRVSREQYNNARKISTTELKEGDLVFFNTRGRGVSHVGIYLGNNFFIHASVSRGVMVSSLFEPYYLQRFVGAGRIDQKEVLASN
jgi:lipoprotein Spr